MTTDTLERTPASQIDHTLERRYYAAKTALPEGLALRIETGRLTEADRALPAVGQALTLYKQIQQHGVK